MNGWIKKSFVAVVVPIIVAFLTTIITIKIESCHERPNIKVIGAMPIHLYERYKGADEFKFATHKLAFIFKIENPSPTPTMAHMAMFEGCVPIPPLVAEAHLSKNGKQQSGSNINELYEKHQKSIQRISSSAIIRQDTQSIPPYGISYIGAIFPLSAQSAYHTVRESISIKGDCRKIKASNPHPSISQVFEIGKVHKERPKNIRNEFKTGQMPIVLFVGSDQLYVPSSILKPLRSLKLSNWEKLALPQMYENPDTYYPPVESSD